MIPAEGSMDEEVNFELCCHCLSIVGKGVTDCGGTKGKGFDATVMVAEKI